MTMNRIKAFVLVLLALVSMAGLSACAGEELDAPLETGPEAVAPGEQDEDALMAEGVDRLGIEGLNLTPEIAQAVDLPADQNGVLVQRVMPASPAEEAGLRAGEQAITVEGKEVLTGGDVIVGFADQQVDSLLDLSSYLLVTEPNERQTLTVLRNGEVTVLEVELGDLPRVEDE